MCAQGQGPGSILGPLPVISTSTLLYPQPGSCGELLSENLERKKINYPWPDLSTEVETAKLRRKLTFCHGGPARTPQEVHSWEGSWEGAGTCQAHTELWHYMGQVQ